MSLALAGLTAAVVALARASVLAGALIVLLVALGGLVVLELYERRQRERLSSVTRPPSDLTMTIGSIVYSDAVGSPGSSVIQIAVTLVNRGSPSTLHDWQMRLTTRDTTTKGHQVVGLASVPTMPQLPDLAQITGLSPMPVGQVTGNLFFVVSVSRQNLEARQARPTGPFLMLISAKDQSDHEWTGHADLHDFWLQGHRVINHGKAIGEKKGP